MEESQSTDRRKKAWFYGGDTQERQTFGGDRSRTKRLAKRPLEKPRVHLHEKKTKGGGV